MEGRSHLLVGLTAGVILDSVFHLTGSPLTMAAAVPLTLIVKKAVFYFMVFSIASWDLYSAHYWHWDSIKW